jgi:exopolysaccharide biosynthesis operon protein EpsL
MRTEPHRRAPCGWRTVPALALCLAPLAVRASLPGDFLTPYVGVSSRYDDNLFRFSDDTDPSLVLGDSHRSDWTRTTFAGASVDWQPGLQRISADISASQQTYDRFDMLDNTGLSGTANWNLAAGDRFTGLARASYQRALGSFEDFRDTRKDVLTTRSTDLELTYLVTPDVELRAGAGTNSDRHELESRSISDGRSRHWLLGAAQRTPLGNRFGVEFRNDDTRYPNRDFTALSQTDNGYTLQTASLTAVWQGGFTELNGKIGYAWRRNDHLSERDNSGLSGDLGLRYAWSAKLALALNAYRRLESLDDVLSSSITETGVELRPTWSLSDRLLVSMQGRYRDRQYDDSGRIPGVLQPRDRLFNSGLTVSYRPRTFLSLSAGVDQGWRHSNRPFYDYDYKAFNVSLQLNL